MSSCKTTCRYEIQSILRKLLYNPVPGKMTSSMTGFAQRTAKTDAGEFCWEIRSVNHRTIDIFLRLPEPYRAVEPEARKSILKRFSRGRIEAVLKPSVNHSDLSLGTVNEEAVKSLLSNAVAVRKYLSADSRQLTTAEVLKWPGVLVPLEQDEDKLREAVLHSLGLALDALAESRQSEGLAIRKLLLKQIETLYEYMRKAQQLIPDAENEYKSRISEKLDKIDVVAEPGRLEQEIVIQLLKMDVKEEIERFGLHLAECEKVLNEDGSIGKRLDFIAQELFREVNSLASKSSHYPLNSLVVDMKVAIEQIREQTQNIQ